MKIYGKVIPIGYTANNIHVAFNIVLYKPSKVYAAYGIHNFESGRTIVARTSHSKWKNVPEEYVSNYREIVKYILSFQDWDTNLLFTGTSKKKSEFNYRKFRTVFDKCTY